MTKSRAILKTADTLFSKFIRQRDGACRRCGSSDASLQCHHLLTRTYRKIRFDPRNGVAVCYGCHKYLTHRPLENEDFAVSILGEETWAELREIARDVSYKVDLQAVVDDLKGKVAA